MNIKGIAHVCIQSSDLVATETFFERVFGLSKIFEFHRQGTVVGFYLEVVPRQFIEVFRSDSIDADPTKHVITHFCLESSDIEADHRTLADAGADPGKLTVGADGTRQFWVTGPDHLRIEFQEYTDASLQFRGGACELSW